MLKACKICLLLITISAFVKCSSGTHHRFNIADGGEKLALKKGESIAVVSRDNSKVSIVLAERLSRQIEDYKILSVVGQDKIGKSIKDYPVVINKENEKKVLSEYVSNLKTTYLLVVHHGKIETVTYQPKNNRRYLLPLYIYIYEYPAGKLLGNASFMQNKMWYRKTLMQKYEDETVIDEILIEAASDIAKRLFQASGYIEYTDKPSKGMCGASCVW